MLLGAIVTLSWHYQEGENLIQKITKSWPFITVCAMVMLSLWHWLTRRDFAALAEIGEANQAIHTERIPLRFIPAGDGYVRHFKAAVI